MSQLSYLTLTSFQASMDGMVRPSPSQPYPAWYLDALTTALARATGIIRRTLASRGYSPTAIAAWVDGPEFCYDLAVYWLYTDSRLDLDFKGEDPKRYDRREELVRVQVTDALGNPIPPDNAGYGNPASSGPIVGIPRARNPRGLFAEDQGYGPYGERW
jgi:hypothetical protein